jgi:hypothetical protein
MKKLLLLSVIILGLYSCKKQEDLITDKSLVDTKFENTWITGNWKVQIAVDTTYNGSKVTSIVTSTEGSPLIFKVDFTGLAVNNKPFTYSLTTMLLNMDARNYKLTKVSDTRFNMTMHDYSTQQGLYYEYIKTK